MRTFPSSRVAVALSASIYLAACNNDHVMAPERTQIELKPVALMSGTTPPIVREAAPGTVLPIAFSISANTPELRTDLGVTANTVVPTTSGTPSLLWFATDGTATIWKMNGPTWSGGGAVVLSIPHPWKFVAASDVNGDGHPDFWWEATTDGTRAVTFMNGAAYGGSYAMLFQFSPDWKIIGAIDFDSNNSADLVVANSVTGANGVLFLNGSSWTGVFRYLPSYGPEWQPVAAQDMNGDSKPDLVFESTSFDPTRTSFLISELDGTSVLAGHEFAKVYSQPLGWRIGAAGDFDSDGKADLVWQHFTTGARKIEFMDGTAPKNLSNVLPSVNVVNAVIGVAAIKYSTGALNLTVANSYVTQGVQDLARSVPLVAGRSALVRAFVTANDYNTAAPTVRVRVVQAAGAFTDYLITRTSDPGVPNYFWEAALGTSYNVTIPGSLINPGARVEITVDPANTIVETNEGDNASTIFLQVRTMPRFDVRFIPVKLSGGATGNVTLANIPNYMKMTMKVWPLSTYDADLHAVFTSAQTTVTTSAAWNAMLSEILNLRTVEGNSRYYYGVLPRLAGSAYGGLAYIGSPAAIGLGALNSSDSAVSEINAHEWGHNFNRPHSPGCGAPSPDASYPVATGNIDSYGYNASSNSVPAPTAFYDIMSYCTPKWVSGWSVKNVMNAIAPLSSNVQLTAVPSLVVWGRITAAGSVVLEPSFQIVTRPKMPEGSGPFAIEGRDASGGVLFSFRFAGTEIGDGTLGDRHFSFAIPLSTIDVAHLQQLHVVQANSHVKLGPLAGRKSLESMVGAPETRETLSHSQDHLELKWNADAYPMVMVRDASTGQVLSFARGGTGRLFSHGQSDLDLTFSDGVHSKTKRIRANQIKL